MLADARQVKCFINTYGSKPLAPECLIEELTGKLEFKGVSPVDTFCGLPDTKI